MRDSEHGYERGEGARWIGRSSCHRSLFSSNRNVLRLSNYIYFIFIYTSPSFSSLLTLFSLSYQTVRCRRWNGAANGQKSDVPERDGDEGPWPSKKLGRFPKLHDLRRESPFPSSKRGRAPPREPGKVLVPER